MHKAAYEMLVSDWSSDVCSSDLLAFECAQKQIEQRTISSKRSCSTRRRRVPRRMRSASLRCSRIGGRRLSQVGREGATLSCWRLSAIIGRRPTDGRRSCYACCAMRQGWLARREGWRDWRAEEPTSERQSLMRLSYGGLLLTKKN